MAPMNEFDPYAPPEAEQNAKASKAKKKSKRAVPRDIAEAIERLNEHLADSNAVERDREEAGGRLRVPTIGFILASIAILFIAISRTFIGGKTPELDPLDIVIKFLAVFVCFITAILVIVDIRLIPRDKPAAPEETLKHFFRAITLGRFGYSWAGLSPTAREQSVEPPVLGPVPVGEGSFVLRSTKDLKDFAQTFIRPGNGQMRTMQVKKVILLREDGDVAICEVVAQFQAWPQWAQIVSVVAFVIHRAAGAAVFLALYFSLRKVHDAVFRKTMIRGNNGVWYVYSADWFEKIERE